MTTFNPSPLQAFLHYYSVERTVSEDSGSNSDTNVIWSRALKHLSRAAIERLIASAEHALATLDNAQIEDMFKNGSVYFMWRAPDAARRYLQELLFFTKRELKTQK